jgi:hypothetical protein
MEKASPLQSVNGTVVKDYAAITESRERLVKGYILILNEAYKDFVQNGKLTTNEIQSLGYILAGLDPDETRSHLADIQAMGRPEVLYTWAISKSSIPFPALTLRQASEGFRTLLPVTNLLGFVAEGHIRLPLQYAKSGDSNVWSFLFEICKKVYPSCEILDLENYSDVIPELDNTIIAKNRVLEFAIARLLELCKSPNSATLRRTERPSLENRVKNAVDFVVLDHIFQRDTSLHNLSLSHYAMLEGRRSVVQEYPGSKGEILTRKLFVGYNLSALLAGYINEKKAPSLESEPFIKFILQLLRDISSQVSSQFTIPKIFFEPPSIELRSSVRRGPDIKTKKGTKSNLYTPFSFAKSSECHLMTETIRRELIDLGSSVLQKLDEPNKLPIREASIVMPFFQEYLKLCYAVSDQCRKEWRQSCFVPNTTPLQVYVSDFPSDIVEAVSSGVAEDYIKRLRRLGHTLTFVPVKDDPSQLASLRKQVEEELKKRKVRR